MVSPRSQGFGLRDTDQLFASESIIVAADACFTQKHSAQKCGRDPPRTHPNTYFIPEEEVNAWKHYADCIRSRKQNQPPPPKRTKPDHTHDDEQDHCEEGLRVPKSVLDGCLASFTAADEARIKGSTRFFDVTANMTLLCRHDRPLFTVNMNTPGEGQHYVLALLAKLFENLPHDTIIRFLYDIGCQLHRSCVKWGFLKPYMSRMTFAVSIFHAFGHQWPCQMIYHPRKCIGCGLSDGEGCERLWHSLSHLIAYGRVAGVGSLPALCFKKGLTRRSDSIMSGCTISTASSTSTMRRACLNWGSGSVGR